MTNLKELSKNSKLRKLAEESKKRAQENNSSVDKMMSLQKQVGTSIIARLEIKIMSEIGKELLVDEKGSLLDKKEALRSFKNKDHPFFEPYLLKTKTCDDFSLLLGIGGSSASLYLKYKSNLFVSLPSFLKKDSNNIHSLRDEAKSAASHIRVNHANAFRYQGKNANKIVAELELIDEKKVNQIVAKLWRDLEEDLASIYLANK